MNAHPLKLRIGLAAMTLALAGTMAACSSSPKTSGSSSPAASSPPASAPAAAATINVVTDPLTVGAFTPPAATISVGQSVQWVFKDSVGHTATSDDGDPASFGSSLGGLLNGATYSFTFTKAGTYGYHCAIHPQMKGTITVQ